MADDNQRALQTLMAEQAILLGRQKRLIEEQIRLTRRKNELEVEIRKTKATPKGGPRR